MSESKVALVTGAGSGIGRCVAATLRNEGWAVVYTGRRIETLDDAVADGDDASGPGKAFACDVSKEDMVDALFAEIEATYGRLDLLFNNAGIGHAIGSIDEVSVDAWRQVVDINLTGSFLCARAAFGLMRRQDPQGGRIINNGSISAMTPRPGSVGYTATKHAISGLTKTIALDGRPYSIACGQIDIGNAETALASQMKIGMPQANGTLMPEPMMDVQVVGDAVRYMASLPLSANSLSMNVMATNMPFVGRG